MKLFFLSAAVALLASTAGAAPVGAVNEAASVLDRAAGVNSFSWNKNKRTSEASVLDRAAGVNSFSWNKRASVLDRAVSGDDHKWRK